jgi:hypothetical protein
MPDSLHQVTEALGSRLTELRARAERLSPLDIHQRMDAIRGEADRHGLDGLEALAHLSAQLALLPGCRVSTGACLAHAADALGARTATERQAVLAAVATRLH